MTSILNYSLLVIWSMLYLVDLFCGAGGFSQGATQAGATVALAIDFWDKALETHSINHPDAKHMNMKLGPGVDHVLLAEIISSSLRDFLDPGDRIHIHASPPCQQLSMVNSFRDETVGLAMTMWALDFLMYFKSYLEILEQSHGAFKTQNYTWTIEQVHNKPLIDILTKRGIANRTFNMIDFGVCQTRRRLVVSSLVLNLTQSPRQTIRQVIKLPDACVRMAGSADWRISDTAERKAITRQCETDVFHTIIRNPHYMLDSEYKHIGLLTSRQSAVIQTFNEHYFDTAIANYTRRVCDQLIANSVPPAFSEKIIRFVNSF